MDPASACSPRNSGRAAVSFSAFQRRFEIRRQGRRFPVLPFCPIQLLLRDVPIRADRAGHTVERTIDEFGNEETAIVDRAGHGRPSLGNGLETSATIIGLSPTRSTRR